MLRINKYLELHIKGPGPETLISALHNFQGPAREIVIAPFLSKDPLHTGIELYLHGIIS